jgi:type II secretion system protein D
VTASLTRSTHLAPCRTLRPGLSRTRTLMLALPIVAGTAAAIAQNDAAPPAAPVQERDAMGRRVTSGKTTTLAFKNVTVEQVIPFIVESTGKVVLPQNEVLSRRITILNDEPIAQSRALDLVLLALQQTGVAVVETQTLITLRDIAEIERQDVPVLGPDESTLERTDVGSVVEKVYALRNASAKNLGEVLEDSIPDYATLAIDEESNQVVLRGNVALLQRMERLITSLDRPNAATLATATFRLRYADADQVATNIRDLYEQNRGQNQNQNQQNQNPFRQFFGPGGGGDQGGGNQRGGGGNQGGNRQGQRGGNQQGQQADATATGASANLRVTSNKQQNSVTVLAEEQVLTQVRSLIETVWDQPLPEEAVIPKIYDLKNSDPIKVRDVLTGLFGSPSTTTQTQSTQGVGRLAGQFSFQAIPEAQRLVVVAKSPDNMFVIDQIIEGLDQPQSAGLPEIIELKHASAEELAEQLNTLLAQEGTLASIRRAESGLTEDSASASPFASTDSQTAATQNTDTAATNSSEFINFWWQRARPPTDSRGSSNLVSKLRIVPVWRQNAVMVLAPAEYRSAVIDLIRDMDKPGRQVLISAVVAEISLEDATALGLRWSSQPINPTNTENAFGVSFENQNTQNNFLNSLFDTSVLNVNADLNVLFQALNEKTAINILSEPRIFTADNQEAEFFDGQDIPFITDSQTNQEGSVVQSFDYRAVGIQLRVRPRITVNRDVDLRVNLELSSIQPQQTLFGGFIVDRRETTTQLIVRNGQTIVISGILRSETSDIKRKIPLLGDIPLLGALFTSIDKEVSRTELVAFITPIVVDNPTEVRELNEPFRQRLGELREELGGQERELPGEAAPLNAVRPETESTASPVESTPSPAPDATGAPPKNPSP